MAQAMDRAAFKGTGSDGEPLGLITGQGTYGIRAESVDASASWSAFRKEVTAFMTANAAASPDAVRSLVRPELRDYLEDQATAPMIETVIEQLWALYGKIEIAELAARKVESPPRQEIERREAEFFAGLDMKVSE